jgi:hypothetical protein
MIMAVFSLHNRPNVVVRGGFPPVPVSITMVGGYPLPRRTSVQSFSSSGYLSWRGRRPCIITHSHIFPPKFLFLNYMGGRIESSCYWTYIVYFWALVQSIKYFEIHSNHALKILIEKTLFKRISQNLIKSI